MMKKQRKIIVVGSLNADLVVTSEKLPLKGQTIIGSQFKIMPGGKGANQAVAAARLGAITYLAGAVGKDDNGTMLLQTLKRDNVDIQFVSEVKNSTGVALITVAKGGSNTIVVVPGANNSVTQSQLDSVMKVVNPEDILITQLEILLDCVAYVLREAKKKQAITILNPSPAQHLPQSLLQAVDILVLNETEAEFLCKKRQSIKKMAAELARLTRGDIIITLGEKGSLLRNKKGIYKTVKALKVNSIDTTAAGDAFTGALAVALSQKKSIEEAIEFANIVGAVATTKLGAQPSLPRLHEVKQLLKI